MLESDKTIEFYVTNCYWSLVLIEIFKLQIWFNSVNSVKE
jgi:hypothetical protein